MREIFSIDGAFYKWGNTLADIMILSLLWVICSIPIITIGASTSAVFYVTTKRVVEKEGYVSKEFFKSFRQNFKQATFTWLLILLMAVFVAIAVALTVYTTDELIIAMRFAILPVQIFITLELMFIMIYIFPLISRFDLPFFEAFRTSFFMANKHIFSSLTCVFLAFACVMFTLVTGIFVLVAMGFYAYLSSYIFVKIFKQYRPEIDDRIQTAEQ